MGLFGKPALAPMDTAELENVIRAAKETVDEILAKAGKYTLLHDDLLDLRGILSEGLPDGR